ncbi:MAG: helix-turn-helix domain-containing protein [Verrucomicrobiales bacterium]
MPIDLQILTDTQIEAELGKRIRIRRVEMGLNQTELAEAAGIGRRTITSVENGAGCKLGTFIALLRVLEALPELATILPPQEVSPIALSTTRVKEERKYPYKPRGKHRNTSTRKPWRWGDEQQAPSP